MRESYLAETSTGGSSVFVSKFCEVVALIFSDFPEIPAIQAPNINVTNPVAIHVPMLVLLLGAPQPGQTFADFANFLVHYLHSISFVISIRQ